jgi:hypothetical protein
MGSEVTAQCECGVRANLLIGGGMANFKTVCAFPCLCESCHNIVQANLLAKPLLCPHCRATNLTPYDDPQVIGELGQRVVAQWNMRDQLGRKLCLTDGKYKCPKCGLMTLRFASSGICFD